MKKVLIILFLMGFFTVSSQTEIDEFVSVSFPMEPSKLDTIFKGMEIKSFYVNYGLDTYQASVTKIGSLENPSSLPYDEKSLNSFYNELIKGQKDRNSESGFIPSNSKELKIDGFIARQISFINSDTKRKNMEFIHVMLNEYSYSFGYIARGEFDNINSSSFFDSINIDNTNSPSQFLGKPNLKNIGYLIGKYTVYGLIIFLVLWLIIRNNKK